MTETDKSADKSSEIGARTTSRQRSDEGAKTLFRAVIALFAATVGFGLKSVLDGHVYSEVHEHRWVLFVVLLLFALRIICGASVHLTETYIDSIKAPHATRSRVTLSWGEWSLSFQATIDVLALIAFAVALLNTADSEQLVEFVDGMLGSTGILLAWGLADAAYRSHHQFSAMRYNVINLVYSVFLFGCAMALRDSSPHVYDLAIVLLVVSLIAACFDIKGSMWNLLDRDADSKPENNSSRP